MAETSGTAAQVFVYGTLRPGESNNAWLAGARHLGPHVTEAAFTLLDIGPYPAALDAGATALRGDVFAVNESVLARLDVLENYPVHYTRRAIATPFGAAWIYLWAGMTDPHWPRVDGGDWCRYRHARH